MSLWRLQLSLTREAPTVHLPPCGAARPELPLAPGSRLPAALEAPSPALCTPATRGRAPVSTAVTAPIRTPLWLPTGLPVPGPARLPPTGPQQWTKPSLEGGPWGETGLQGDPDAQPGRVLRQVRTPPLRLPSGVTLTRDSAHPTHTARAGTGSRAPQGSGHHGGRSPGAQLGGEDGGRGDGGPVLPRGLRGQLCWSGRALALPLGENPLLGPRAPGATLPGLPRIGPGPCPTRTHP